MSERQQAVVAAVSAAYREWLAADPGGCDYDHPEAARIRAAWWAWWERGEPLREAHWGLVDRLREAA